MTTKPTEALYWVVRMPRYEKDAKPTLYRVYAKPHGEGLKGRSSMPVFSYSTILRRQDVQNNPQEALDKFRADLEQACKNLHAQFEEKQALLMSLPTYASEMPERDAHEERR